jgi:hypothetical protein
MRLRLALWAVAAAATLFATEGRSDGQTIHYVLTDESYLVRYCHTCAPPFMSIESLTGVFDLTVMQVPSEQVVEAITGVKWTSKSSALSGTGFLQRLGADQVAMVIDANTDGKSVLLTSGRRQASPPNEIRIQLKTPGDRERVYEVTLVAEPYSAEGPDADGDGVVDSIDNCPNLNARDQTDEDHDGVGDACDACPDTPAGSPVLADGCAPTQRCPCDGPSDTEEWRSQRAYVQCIARSLKTLSEAGKVSRSRVREIIQEAVRSTCGRKELALR